MIEWPEEVVTAIARRRSVLFLGAGVSMNAINEAGHRPPSWDEFLKRGIEKCPGNKNDATRALKDKDYLLCNQFIKNKLGADWVGFLESVFSTPNFGPGDIHSAILSLDSSIVATPNFDKIYDKFAQSSIKGNIKVKRFFDEDIPRALRGGHDQRLILKVHGCIDTPDNLIFTKEDYANARSKYQNFYRSLDALFLTHTFLFLGCGLSDPDMNLLLEQYTRSFSGAPPHYVTLAGKISDDYRRILESNYNLKVLTYSATDHHRELLISIQNLNEKVVDKRGELSRSGSW